MTTTDLDLQALIDEAVQQALAPKSVTPYPCRVCLIETNHPSLRLCSRCASSDLLYRSDTDTELLPFRISRKLGFPPRTQIAHLEEDLAPLSLEQADALPGTELRKIYRHNNTRFLPTTPEERQAAQHRAEQEAARVNELRRQRVLQAERKQAHVVNERLRKLEAATTTRGA